MADLMFGRMLSGLTGGLVKGKLYVDQKAAEEAKARREEDYRAKMLGMQERGLGIQERGLGLQERRLELEGDKFEDEKRNRAFGIALDLAKNGKIEEANSFISKEVGPEFAFFQNRDKDHGIVKGNDENLVHYWVDENGDFKHETITVPPETADLLGNTKKSLEAINTKVGIVDKAIGNLAAEWNVDAPTISSKQGPNGSMIFSMDEGKKGGFFKTMVEWAYKTDPANPAEERTIIRAKQALQEYEQLMDIMVVLSSSATGIEIGKDIMTKREMLRDAAREQVTDEGAAKKADMAATSDAVGATPEQKKRFVDEAVGPDDSKPSDSPTAKTWKDNMKTELKNVAADWRKPTREELEKADEIVSRRLNIEPGTYMYVE